MLAKLVYTGVTIGNGAVVLTSTSTSGLKDADASATVVTAGNAPVVVVPATQNVVAGATQTLLGYTVTDANGLTQILTANITATNGTFQLSGFAGLSQGGIPLIAIPAAANSVTVTGTAAAITTASQWIEATTLKFPARVRLPFKLFILLPPLVPLAVLPYYHHVYVGSGTSAAPSYPREYDRGHTATEATDSTTTYT